MDLPDSIRKELTLSAPRDRVWRALTDPAELLRWFPHARGGGGPSARGHRAILVDDERDDMIAGNTTGWAEELEELRALVESPDMSVRRG